MEWAISINRTRACQLPSLTLSAHTMVEFLRYTIIQIEAIFGEWELAGNPHGWVVDCFVCPQCVCWSWVESRLNGSEAGWLVGSTWRTRARRRARKGKKDLLIMSDAMDVHAYVCVIMFIDKGLLRLNRDSANEWVSAWLDTEESPAKQVCSRRRNGQNQSSVGGGEGGRRKGSKGGGGGDGRTLRIYRGEFQRCTINRFF